MPAPEVQHVPMLSQTGRIWNATFFMAIYIVESNRYIVEAGGVEPPSEKRNATEPTCLSQFVSFARRAWNEQETQPASPMVLARALRTERLRPAHCMTLLTGPMSKARGSVRLTN